jgi:hypothetical protein
MRTAVHVSAEHFELCAAPRVGMAVDERMLRRHRLLRGRVPASLPACQLTLPFAAAFDHQS